MTWARATQNAPIACVRSNRALESETFQTLARDVAPRADIAAIARVHPLEYIEALRGSRTSRWTF